MRRRRSAFGRALQRLFFALLVRPVVLVLLGLNVRHRERLPQEGPAVVIANHNSHLDTVVLMTLLPKHLLSRVRPVAAADYFLANRWIAWFGSQIMNILPINRVRPSAERGTDDILDPLHEALGRGEILVLFPEGTRGEAETPQRFKSGVARLMRQHPEVPLVPVFLHGLGKSLPKGAIVPIPFFVDVFVGEAIPWSDEPTETLERLETSFEEIRQDIDVADWL